MRVTNKMLTSSLLTNVNNNLNQLQKYENQLSSKVKVDKISDNPVAAAKILKAKSELKAQEQYSTNMEYTSGWLRSVDDALASVDDVLLRAREIAVRGSNGATAIESSKAMGEEVNSIIGELVHIANTDYNGSYIFAGGRNGNAPFTITEDGINVTVHFDGGGSDLADTYSQKVEISKGVTIDLSAGQMSFHTEASGDTRINSVFSTLDQLRKSLMNGEQVMAGNLIGEIDSLINNVISERAVVGAKSNRIEQAKDRAESFNASINTLISILEDTDYAEASALYKTQQAVYEASLTVGANIIQPSLLDFLR